jgi:MFS family permease
MTTASSSTARRQALGLLLLINLFCYLDRYILAAVVPALKAEFLAGDPKANTKAGLLTSAFLISYMITAPLFGWLADRFSRWVIIGLSVGVWSLASGASGLAASFTVLLLTRVFLGIGEAGYGPAAPTIISDLYPVEKRGQVLAWFFMAIPVGSALGYVFGGMVEAHWGWRWAFYLVAPPGLLLALVCFFRRDPRQGQTRKAAPATLADYQRLLKIPSLLANFGAQTAMTFAIGGMSVWAPTYIHETHNIPIGEVDKIFGLILAVTGLVSTLLGGWLGDRLRARFPGSYFLVSGCGMLLAFPATIAMTFSPFPLGWVFIFIAMFFLFMNIGPANTAIANVTPVTMRATAFALNILIIHLFGDVPSPPLIGWIKDVSNWNFSFFVVSFAMLVAGVIWLCSMKALVRDTAAEAAREQTLG